MPSREEKLSTIQKIFSGSKGILAADESVPTAGKRLESIGVPSTPETRQKYREIFLTTPGIESYLSGVIFFDETFRQSLNGKSFPKLVEEKGIVPGIKVDKGAVDSLEFPGEKITVGLDGLPARLAEYYALGARFAKWRAVITIGNNIPTDGCLIKNAGILAEYSKNCLDAGIVPIIEPEVLLDGEHSIEKSEAITTKTLRITFNSLKNLNLPLNEVILKTSMVVPGNKSGEPMDPSKIAEATVRCLKNSVPAEVGGIVFLSGGQTPVQATVNLNAISKLKPLPWPTSFSYARALQGDPLKIWQGKDENILAAQAVFLKRLKLNCAANRAQAEQSSYDGNRGEYRGEE
ncbi:MAG: fructose-bisphosphate aldolase class I [Candidatus Liptonbacteria bacterium]|nr:fructose-bisphosphate aldolase class I [Candidatus Liptonbacteria bacterium]